MAWAEASQSLLTLGRVLLAFTLALIVAPLLATPAPEGERPADAFWRAFLLGATFWIGIVYLLAAMHLYDLITLVGVVLASWIALRRFAPALDAQHRLEWRQRQIGLLYELLDPATPTLKRLLRNARLSLRAWLRRRWAGLRDPLGIVTGLVFGASAVLRLAGPFVQVAPSVPDEYTHLLWTNLLMQSQIFPQGVYPEGYHALAAVLASFFFIDPLNVLRFLGPLAGLLMVASLYQFVLEVTGSRLAALVAAAFFGLSTASPLPEAAWRQISPLPEEFSAIFFPLALTHAVRYLRTGRRRELWFALLACLVAALVHPYGAFFAVIVGGCLALGAALLAPRRLDRAAALIAALAGGALAGLLPLAAGRLAGIPFYSGSISYVLQPVTTAQAAADHVTWAGFFGSDPFVPLGVAIALALVVTALAARVPADRRQMGLGLGLALLAMLAAYRISSYGLPLLPDPTRSGEFYSLTLAAIGAAWCFGGALGRHEHRGAGSLVALALLLPPLLIWPPGFPLPGRYEPRGAARAYLDIRNQFRPYDWTIVAPVQQYAETAGHGWDVELIDFVRRFSAAQAGDPDFLLADAGPGAISTPDVFVYVETRPLGLDRALQPADFTRPLPAGNGQDVYDGSALAAIEARTYAWAIAYLKAHPGNASIYYQTPSFFVLRILNQPSVPAPAGAT